MRRLFLAASLLLPASLAAALLLALPAMAAPPANPVDACALLSNADVESVLGGPLLGKPVALPSEEPLRRECIYTRKDEKLGLAIGTAPAVDFDAILKRQSDSKPATAVSGLGQKAFQTPFALLIQPVGKAYFLIIAVMTPEGVVDTAKTLIMAKKLKLDAT